MLKVSHLCKNIYYNMTCKNSQNKIITKYKWHNMHVCLKFTISRETAGGCSKFSNLYACKWFSFSCVHTCVSNCKTDDLCLW